MRVVVQKAELFQFRDQLLQAPIVMQNLAIVAGNGLMDESIGIYSIARAARAVHDCTAAVLSLIRFRVAGDRRSLSCRHHAWVPERAASPESAEA